jgi:hypothetical protein
MTENVQAIEAKSDPRRWTGLAPVSAVIALILALLFVFPGFVAAGFSKSGVTMLEVNEHYWGVGEYTPRSSGGRARTQMAQVVLYPAFLLALHSRMVSELYTWEFQWAGGQFGTWGY